MVWAQGSVQRCQCVRPQCGRQGPLSSSVTLVGWQRPPQRSPGAPGSASHRFATALSASGQVQILSAVYTVGVSFMVGRVKGVVGGVLAVCRADDIRFGCWCPCVVPLPAATLHATWAPNALSTLNPAGIGNVSGHTGLPGE